MEKEIRKEFDSCISKIEEAIQNSKARTKGDE